MIPVLNERASDADLWQLVNQGSTPAFEVLVRRHQSLVCEVAYNACGDLATSEDVAQETFWTAWRQRTALKEPGRLRAWLCGIARNLGKNAQRRQASHPAGPLDDATGLPTGVPGPAEQAVSHEEESLLWQALGQIPEAYREPLILFYREGQSAAEVADALGLSPDAVKQRLSRGRGMLRDQVAKLVEDALRRSRPCHSFAVGVLAGLTTPAAKGAGASLPGVIGAGLASGFVGGILGSLGGLAGAWFGTWFPAQLAPTKGEREFLRRTGRRMLLVSLLFNVVLIGSVLALAERWFVYYMIFWATWMVTFGAYVTVESIRAAREVNRLRAAGGEPNDAPLRRGLEAIASRYRGRVFRSRGTLFGLPLIDVNVSDPLPPSGPGRSDAAPVKRRVARGWIAIGDDARGILLAVGNTARGFVAVGGRAVGALSLGGIAVGLIAVGGLSVGVLAIGGLGVGVLAIGGGAVGWQAAGGGAIAWDVAVGGGAVARHAAFGGAAIADEYAVGGGAWVRHGNDDAAEAVLLAHPLTQGMQGYVEAVTCCNAAWVLVPFLLFCVLVPCAMIPLMYRREKGG
jgi:RNA polymerase sigma factor (sigma-70 family)